MPIDNLNEAERITLITIGAGAIGWLFKVAIPKLFGMTRARVTQLETKNDALELALAHMLSAFEILLVAIELPQDARGQHVDRAKGFVKEAQKLRLPPDACGALR